MSRHTAGFGRAQWLATGIAYGLFAVLVAWACSQQSPGDRRDNWEVAATLAAFAGPFTGGVARHGQRCCWEVGVQLLPWVGVPLLVSLGIQWSPLPRGVDRLGARVTALVLGLLCWVGGGVLSLLHAFS